MRTLDAPARAEGILGEPMKVTAIMGEPVVYFEDGMHFDGPLSFGAYVEYVREHGDNLPPMGAWALDFDLPLSRWTVPAPAGVDPRLLDTDGRLWGWRASAAQADWVAQGRLEVRKRPAEEAMIRYTRAASHHSGMGPLKAKDIAHPTLLAFEIQWYAHGDRKGVERLLSYVTHIGALVGHGPGRVLRWVVEPMGVDWSCERDGKLMRVMPREGGPRRSIRAPYHHRSRRAPTAFPGEPA